MTTAKQCPHMGGSVTQCCREKDHSGGHRYKCAGEFCPGLPYVASRLSHPTTCAKDPSAPAALNVDELIGTTWLHYRNSKPYKISELARNPNTDQLIVVYWDINGDYWRPYAEFMQKFTRFKP